MKLLAPLAVAATLCVPIAGLLYAQSNDAADAGRSASMTKEQKLSYALGFVLRQRIEEAGVQIDEGALIAGFRAPFGETPPAMSPDEMESVLRTYLAEYARTHAQPEGDDAPKQDRPARRPSGEPPILNMGRTPAQPQSGHGLNLRIDERVGPVRLDTAVPETRRNTIRAENPNLDREDRPRQ